MTIPSYSKAIVSPPARSFASGLTTASLGVPDLTRASEQHAAYCQALRDAGLELIELLPDERFPDSTFVEDTAIVSQEWAVLTRPGAQSRAGEVERMGGILSPQIGMIQSIVAPATLDGGDVCEIGNHILIGLSQRTNLEGCEQLSRILDSKGHSSEVIDIRGLRDILHLKSGIAYLGEGHAVIIESLRQKVHVKGLQLNVIPRDEEYAANCIRVNDKVFIAAGYPRTAEILKSLVLETIELDMSEFQKMDGGLSCLSLRF